MGLRQCLAFADLLWRFCLIFTPGRVWLMIVTVFSSCHTQIYINITQLPLPGLYIMTFVFVFRYSLTKLGNLSFPHRCIPIVKQNTITWLFSPDQQSMEHHNIVVQRDSIICCLFPPQISIITILAEFRRRCTLVALVDHLLCYTSLIFFQPRLL